MKRIVTSAIAVSLVFMLSGCSLFGGGTPEPEPTSPPAALEPLEEKDVKAVETVPEKAVVRKEHVYAIKQKFFESTFLAPSYINEKLIAFEYDRSNESKSYISMMEINSKSVKDLYTAPDHKIINSLVGIKNILYWVEYDRERVKELSWEIRSLDLSTNDLQTIRKGGGIPEIDAPVLRIYGDDLTWIEKKKEKEILTSYAILFKPSAMKAEIVAEAELDETGGKRTGTFFVLQRPIKNGMLIQQTSFASKSEKKVQLVHYGYDNKEAPQLLKDGLAVIDFTANEDWFVWTEMGKITAALRKTGEIKHIVEVPDKELTVDSPFITDQNQLYYRYSMYQILSLDLVSGKISEESPFELTTSKLFNSENYLGYSIMDPLKNDGEVEFNLIPTG
ncbi:hypothetical protein ACLBWT_05350 [Paenibacillus sp. D51F]